MEYQVCLHIHTEVTTSKQKKPMLFQLYGQPSLILKSKGKYSFLVQLQPTKKSLLQLRVKRKKMTEKLGPLFHYQVSWKPLQRTAGKVMQASCKKKKIFHVYHENGFTLQGLPMKTRLRACQFLQENFQGTLIKIGDNNFPPAFTCLEFQLLRLIRF